MKDDGSHVAFLAANGMTICELRQTSSVYFTAARLVVRDVIVINGRRHEVIGRGTSHVSGYIAEGRKLRSWNYQRTTITVAQSKRAARTRLADAKLTIATIATVA